MDQQKYLSERVESQQKWYSKNSQKNKSYFISLAMIQAISALLIPFIIVLSNQYPLIPDKIIVSLLGVITATCIALSSVNKFHENWTKYRTTSEQLKQEKYLFLTKTRPYNQENAFPLYVERNELIIATEHSKWLEQVESTNTPEKKE